MGQFLNMFYKKLDLTVPDISFKRDGLKLVQVSDVHNRDKYKYTRAFEEDALPTPLNIYALPQEVSDAIVAQLPKSVLEQEVPKAFYMEMPKPCAESKHLPPHIDRARRCAINIYLACDGEETKFYADVDGELQEKDSFIAKPNEAWLLDVSKPHSVSMKESMLRSSISISFRKLSFDKLNTLLQESV